MASDFGFITRRAFAGAAGAVLEVAFVGGASETLHQARIAPRAADPAANPPFAENADGQL